MKNFEREEVENITNQKLKRYGSPSNLLHGVVLAWAFIILYVLLEATPIKILLYRSFHYSIVYIIHVICYIFFGVLLFMSMVSFYYYFKTPSYLSSNVDHTKIIGSPDKKRGITNATSRKINFDIIRRNKSLDNASNIKKEKPQYAFYSPTINPVVDPTTPMSTSSKFKQFSPTMRSSSLYSTPLTDPTVNTHTRKSDIIPSSFKRTSAQTKGIYTQQSQLQEFTKQVSPPSIVKSPSHINDIPELAPKYRASPSPRVVMNRTDDSDVKSDIYNEPAVSKNIDIWVENIMKWICKHILKDLYKKIKKYENQLQLIKDISDLKSTPQPTQSTLGQFQTTSTLSTWKPTIQLNTQQQQQQQQQQQDDRSEKEEIYEYLKSFGSEFLYVYERIGTLQSDNVMKEFKWDGGGSYNGKPWTKELPCDAQIVMNLFCEHLNLISTFRDSSRLTILLSHNQDIPNKTGIKMKETYPPYYILYDSGKDIPLKKGRQNVFHAICLFLYLVDKGGRFFQRLDFGKIPGLLDVVKR